MTVSDPEPQEPVSEVVAGGSMDAVDWIRQLQAEGDEAALEIDLDE